MHDKERLNGAGAVAASVYDPDIAIAIAFDRNRR
jgi:hypothetical protein